MIKINKILSADKTRVMGVGISINEENYFISADQHSFPGIRAGKHPRYQKSLAEFDNFPEKEILIINP